MTAQQFVNLVESHLGPYRYADMKAAVHRHVQRYSERQRERLFKKKSKKSK